MLETFTSSFGTLSMPELPFLLEATIKSTIVLLAALATTTLLRGRSAALRHVVWSGAIFLALVLPGLSAIAPAVEVAIPRLDGSPASGAAAPTLDASPARAVGSETTLAGNALAGASTSLEPNVAPSEAAAAGPTADAGALAASTPPAAGGLDAAVLVPTIWLVGASAVLLALLAGLARLRWTAMRATRVVSGPLYLAGRRAALRLRLDRLPVILQGDDRAIPMTWGLRRTFVLLPAGAEAWPRPRLDAVLLHELGHAGRRDFLQQLVAHCACAVHWFNPLVWLGARRMRIERELACDDVVVGAGHEPSRYADDLLSLARSFRRTPGPRAVAVGMGPTDDLRVRLVALLDEHRARAPLTRVTAVGVAGCVLAAAALLAPLTPAGPGEAEARPSMDAPATIEVDPVGQHDSSPTPELAVAGMSEGSAPPAGMATGEPANFRTASVQEATVLCGPADGSARRRAHLSENDVTRIETEYGECKSEIRIEGDISFTSDFSAIASLAPGAALRFDIDRPGAERRLDIRPGAGGRPEHRWLVDGRERPFGEDAERWLSSALLEMFRMGSYKAEERAAWILSERGVEGVFSEVGQMFSDHAQAIYLAILLEDRTLTPAQVRDALDLAGREIESDHSLGEVLLATAANQRFDDLARTAFLRAATTIESDHTQGKIFLEALSRGDLSATNLELLLDAAAGSIASDHTLSEVLIELATRYSLDPALRAPYLEAAATIDSDHNAGEVYGVLLERDDLRGAELVAVIEALAGIDSDHELSRRLIQLADRPLAPEQQRAFLTVAASIDSDHSLSRTLGALLNAGGLGEAEQAALLETARLIGSDPALADLLVEFADRYPVEGQVRAALRAAADEISSDRMRERVLARISDR